MNKEQWLDRIHQAKIRKQQYVEVIKAELSASFEQRNGVKPTYFFVM